MFSETAAYYDQIYGYKDYQAEAGQILDLVDTHLAPCLLYTSPSPRD